VAPAGPILNSALARAIKFAERTGSTGDGFATAAVAAVKANKTASRFVIRGLLAR
jgi:hypothetical protein